MDSDIEGTGAVEDVGSANCDEERKSCTDVPADQPGPVSLVDCELMSKQLDELDETPVEVPEPPEADNELPIEEQVFAPIKVIELPQMKFPSLLTNKGYRNTYEDDPNNSILLFGVRKTEEPLLNVAPP